MEKCPYCKGSGFLGNGYVEKKVSGHRVLYPHTEPCYCKVNKSINKRYPILSALPLPLPEDTNKVHKTFKDKNYLMYGTEEYFLYIVKSYFMKGFMYKDFIVLEGGTIVEQYHVVREDWLTTSHLNQYDFLVLLFTSSSRYNSMKDCVVDVIKNRNRLSKVTWLYVPIIEKLTDTREYSTDLEIYIKEEKYIRYDVDRGIKLKGFSSAKTIMKAIEIHANDSLGNS
jgi:hypothetical protein